MGENSRLRHNNPGPQHHTRRTCDRRRYPLRVTVSHLIYPFRVTVSHTSRRTSVVGSGDERVVRDLQPRVEPKSQAASGTTPNRKKRNPKGTTLNRYDPTHETQNPPTTLNTKHETRNPKAETCRPPTTTRHPCSWSLLPSEPVQSDQLAVPASLEAGPFTQAFSGTFFGIMHPGSWSAPAPWGTILSA